MPSFYLGGPINGLAFEHETKWRREMQKALEPDIKCVSPLRGKEYLAEVGVLEHQHPMSTGKAVVGRCRWDVSRCDAAIFNFLDATKVSVGSVMEIAWCDMLRKPTILIIEPVRNIHDQAFLTETVTFRVSTTEEAVQIARAMFA